mgnify:CR=1 FL=1
MDPILEHHFYNIANNAALKNEDGTISTVRSAIVEMDGDQVLIPTIWDGQEVDLKTAINNAKKSGVNWSRATGEDAEFELQTKDDGAHKYMNDQTSAEEAKIILDEYYSTGSSQRMEDNRELFEQEQSYLMDKYPEDYYTPTDEGLPTMLDVLKDTGKLGGLMGLYAAEKIGFDTSPFRSRYKGGDTEMALGGLATANKGITTPEGLDMANKKFQLDDKEADTNGDGRLTTREKEVGKAVQRNVDPEVTDDDKVQMSHGGMATMGDSCGCGVMSDEECMCGIGGGLMGFDGISGNPIPVGSNAENVRDDIDAKLSTDEYVLPAHVVKWHGLKHIQMMQSEAEMGLMSMQMDGLIQQVGGEEDEYEHHMMYDPKTGEGRMTKSYDDHLDLKNQGWSHESETDEESDSTGSKDSKVSSESNSKQKGAEAEAEASEEIYSPEGVDVEVATIEVDDKLDDEDDTKKLKPKTSKLPSMLKSNSFAFRV